MRWTKVAYEKLNARQKESYNFQKVSAILAEYGFATIRLTDDWEQADFIAQNVKGDFIKVQLKGRFTFDKKYVGKDLWIAFPNNQQWYFYPHDELLSSFEKRSSAETESWKTAGKYSFSRLSKEWLEILSEYKI